MNDRASEIARDEVPLSERLRFGVAGWSYPDWEGIVYREKGRDKLEFLSGFVDVVEINSTFYRPPAAAQCASWLRRTENREGFRFTAKLYQEVTHRRSLDRALAEAIREGFRPLAEAGRLSHLLAQFRWDFADTAAGRALLGGIRELYGDLAEIVVEVRHGSWQSPEALRFLEGLGVTVANLDYPLARSSFSLRECRVGTNGYFRLHGRNRAAWFDREAGRDETYDYLYSPEELAGLKERALAIARGYRTLTIIANNHFRGKELANILELQALVRGGKVRVPPGLIEEYPRLGGIASEG